MPLDPRKPRRLYKVAIPEDPDAEAIIGMGIVTKPAIERGFQAFSASDGNPNHFSLNVELTKFKGESNRILVGAAMIPDQLIPRIDENGEPFDIVFTKDAVAWLANNFERRAAKNPELRRALNFEHSDMKVQGEITNSYIQRPNDFSKALGVDSTDGAWIISCFIEDLGFFKNFIEDEIATGFSIELVMDKELVFAENYKRVETLPKQSNEDARLFIQNFAQLGQTPLAGLINRVPTTAASNLARLSKSTNPLAVKIANRSELNFFEFAELTASFVGLEDYSGKEAQAFGGQFTAEWIESEFKTLESKLTQAERYGVLDDLASFVEQARFNKFMRKLKALKKEVLAAYETKREFEKLTAEDGLKYFLENEESIKKLFKKKGLL